MRQLRAERNRVGDPAIEELTARIGTELGLSDWLLVDQAMIDAFADATGDRQFIHVDPVAAAATPFGGTIAHGFLLLSLMPRLAEDARLPRPAGLVAALNYGGDRTRFVTPVRSGARVRGRFRLLGLDETRPGWWRQRIDYTLEIKGAEEPALVAEWLSTLVVQI